MGAIDFVEPWYYATVYYIIFLIISWMTVLYYIGSNGQKILKLEGSNPMQGVAILFTLILVFFIGLRPISGKHFGDMSMYSHMYLNIINDYVPVSFSKEWFWENLAVFCKKSGLNVYEYFLIISFGYFVSMLICSFILMRKNLWIASLFFFISFSCYAYGTNGIRNGLACSFALVAICLLAEGGLKRPLAFVLMLLAIGIHRSVMLPCVAAIVSTYFIKDTKWTIRFWVASIAISLVAGPMVESFFSALGFDDRMVDYTSLGQSEQSMSQFSSTGFRWDFLFYSMFPVIMTWYVTRHRNFNDKVFMIFANTYLLCNAFWIMVIRSSYSNRFAYLSWFIYPVIIAYPLLRMNLWKDQDRRTALIFFLYSGFTLFMFFFYYFGTISGFRGFNQYWWR